MLNSTGSVPAEREKENSLYIAGSVEMISLQALDELIKRGARIIALIGFAGMLLLSVVIVLEVGSRTLLNFPVLGVFDFTYLGMGISIASCLPLVFIERRNISVRIIGKFTNPRVNAFFDGFGNLVALFIYSLMVWQLWLYVKDLAAVKETTIIAQIPVTPWIAFMILLLALCIPVQALCFLRDVTFAFKSKGQKNTEEENVKKE